MRNGLRRGLTELPKYPFGRKCRTSKDLLLAQRRQPSCSGQDNPLMNAPKIFFDSLAKLPVREQAAVLIPAFEHAQDDELTTLAERLVQTQRPEALAALIRRWDCIDRNRRLVIAQLPSDPRPAIDLLLSTGEPLLRCRAIDFIVDRDDVMLAPVLVDVLVSEDGDTRSHAAAAILHLTVNHADPRRSRLTDPRSTAALDHALARSLDQYRSHRSDDVLLAAAIMSRNPGPELQAIFDQSDHPGTVALRGVPQRIEDDLVRVNLILWLGVGIMQRPALRWLDSISTVRHWNDVLAAGHLLGSPERRRAMRRYPKPRRLLPDVAVAVQLDGLSQASLVDWVRACGLTTPHRVDYLRDLIALPSPLARVKVVRSLAQLARAGVVEAIEALRPFTRDGNSSVARLALRTLRDVGIEARNERMRDADALVQSWPELDRHRRLLAASRLAASDPDEAVRALRMMLKAHVRDHAIAAMTMIARMGFAGRMRDDLVAALESDDAHVAAYAASVLGRAASRDRDEQMIRHLQQMLDHENTRVRANAAEAIADASRALTGRAIDDAVESAVDFVSLTMTDDNRLRANAVRAMLLDDVTRDEANSYWQAMVRDDRPLHRISAIWVAGRTPCGAMLDELHRLASPDEPLLEVRTRAEVTAKWIERVQQTQNVAISAS